MATTLKNLSEFSSLVPRAEGFRFAIVVSEWNIEITSALLEGAKLELLKAGCEEDDIMIKFVPGAFELAMGAQFVCEYTDVDAVICLGCIIKGGTPHFDFVSAGTTQGIAQVMLEYNTPIAFGVLTTDDLEQAHDRCGGKYGNKGTEAAATAIKMVVMKSDMEENEE